VWVQNSASAVPCSLNAPQACRVVCLGLCRMVFCMWHVSKAFPLHLQACKAVSVAYKVTIDAQPPQAAEQLALKQASMLREELPRPQDSIHYQRVRRHRWLLTLCAAFVCARHGRVPSEHLLCGCPDRVPPMQLSCARYGRVPFVQPLHVRPDCVQHARWPHACVQHCPSTCASAACSTSAALRPAVRPLTGCREGLQPCPAMQASERTPPVFPDQLLQCLLQQ